MKKLLLLLILSFFSAQGYATSCPDGSEPVKSVSEDGTYFVYNCGNTNSNPGSSSKTIHSSEGKTVIYDQKGGSIGPTMSGYNNHMSPWKYAFKIVENPYPVRYGKTSERFELRYGDCGQSDCVSPYNTARSEISMKKHLVQARYNKDIWYGLSFYNETIPKNGLITNIFQWKDGVQSDDAWGSKPIIFIQQRNQDSNSSIMWEHCDSSFCSNHLETQDSYDVGLNLGQGGKWLSNGYSNNWNTPCRLFSMEENQGKWADIVLNTNFGTDENGYINIWINGEKRCEYKGALLDQVPTKDFYYLGPVHKRGIYISRTKMKTKTHPTLIDYFDEFRVGKSRAEVDIRMIEDSNYQPPKDKCTKGFININGSCIKDISNKYDRQYMMYLYSINNCCLDKNIVNATIEIKDGLVKAVKANEDLVRYIHRKIDNPLDSFKGTVASDGEVDWSITIDPWNKSQRLWEVKFKGSLKEGSLNGRYDLNTELRIELKPLHQTASEQVASEQEVEDELAAFEAELAAELGQ